MRELFTTRRWSFTSLLVGLVSVLMAGPSPAADYKTADEALAAAAPLVRAKNYAASREPLEAALRLAPDDAFRLKVYEYLQPAYRELPESDKMVEAAEFIISHADQKAKRSLECRSLVSFLFQRGKLDEAVAKYEARLKERSDDIVALGVLNATYSQVRRDKKERAAAVAATLAIVDKQLAAQRAERLERGAGADPAAAAHQYKDAALAWLEASDTPRALAAAKKSKAGPPEDRSGILKYYWHKGLGDVFAAADQPADAKAEYEAALNFAPGDIAKKELQKKLDEPKPKEKK
jgi:hypothetical protein